MRVPAARLCFFFILKPVLAVTHPFLAKGQVWVNWQGHHAEKNCRRAVAFIGTYGTAVPSAAKTGVNLDGVSVRLFCKTVRYLP
jgi:hypothetical protein